MEDNVEPDLECMWSKDGAWWTISNDKCVVRRRRWGGPFLEVSFEQDSSKDKVPWSDFDTRLRLAGRQVQDNECEGLLPGMDIIALHIEGGGGKPLTQRYIDAEIILAHHVPHKEGVCECKFTVKWQPPPPLSSLKLRTKPPTGTSVLGIDAICFKQPTEDFLKHPDVRRWREEMSAIVQSLDAKQAERTSILHKQRSTTSSLCVGSEGQEAAAVLADLSTVHDKMGMLLEAAKCAEACPIGSHMASKAGSPCASASLQETQAQSAGLQAFEASSVQPCKRASTPSEDRPHCPPTPLSQLPPAPPLMTTTEEAELLTRPLSNEPSQGAQLEESPEPRELHPCALQLQELQQLGGTEGMSQLKEHDLACLQPSPQPLHEHAPAEGTAIEGRGRVAEALGIIAKAARAHIQQGTTHAKEDFGDLQLQVPLISIGISDVLQLASAQKSGRIHLSHSTIRSFELALSAIGAAGTDSKLRHLQEALKLPDLSPQQAINSMVDNLTGSGEGEWGLRQQSANTLGKQAASTASQQQQPVSSPPARQQRESALSKQATLSGSKQQPAVPTGSGGRQRSVSASSQCHDAHTPGQQLDVATSSKRKAHVPPEESDASKLPRLSPISHNTHAVTIKGPSELADKSHVAHLTAGTEPTVAKPVVVQGSHATLSAQGTGTAAPVVREQATMHLSTGAVLREPVMARQPWQLQQQPVMHKVLQPLSMQQQQPPLTPRQHTQQQVLQPPAMPGHNVHPLQQTPQPHVMQQPSHQQYFQQQPPNPQHLHQTPVMQHPHVQSTPLHQQPQQHQVQQQQHRMARQGSYLTRLGQQVCEKLASLPVFQSSGYGSGLA